MTRLQERCDGCGKFVEECSLVVDPYDDTKSICRKCSQKNVDKRGPGGAPIICFVCNKPITPEQMGNRQWIHEWGCDYPFGDVGACKCEKQYHENCFPAEMAQLDEFYALTHEIASTSSAAGPEIICFVCGEPITDEQMDGREWYHEPWCNHGTPEWERDGCMCDLESHAGCIPAEGTVLVEDEDDDDDDDSRPWLKHWHAIACHPASEEPELWQCEKCLKWVSMAEGTDNEAPNWCDACWAAKYLVSSEGGQ